MNFAVIPEPVNFGGWMGLHQQYVTEAKEQKPNVVFIGDSLIKNMQLTEVWDHYFGPLNALNFGIGGDRTENVLWRVINGEMDIMEPKVVILLVGTNNIDNTDKEVTEGILKIAQEIHTRQKQAQLILLGIPPKGKVRNKYRDLVEQINKGLSEQFGSVPNCTFFPTDPRLFVNDNGLISETDMYDYLHLTSAGYKKICEPLRDLIQQKLLEFQ